jgi:small-conductance mechanosensitive channel
MYSTHWNECRDNCRKRFRCKTFARVSSLLLILFAPFYFPFFCAPLLGASNRATAVTSGSVLKYLDLSIDWYRRINALDQNQVNSQELLYRDSVHNAASQALTLAFEFANAQAAIIDGQTKPAAGSSATSSTTAHLKQAAAAADQRVTDITTEIGELPHSDNTPSDAALRAKLTAELALATTQRDALKYAGFMATNTSGGADSLSDKVDRLKATVPELNDDASPADASTDASGNPSPTASASPTKPPSAPPVATEPEQFHPESAGIITLITELFTITQQMNELSQLKDRAVELQQACDEMRQPIRGQIMDDMRRANAMSSTTQDARQAAAADTTQSSDQTAKLDSDRRDLETLTADFKLTSSSGIPLGEESAILAAAAQNLASWHEALERQYAASLRALLLRTLGTILVVIILVIISELWRRATFRYINDVRRRRQLMLVRRIVIGAIVVMIIIGSVVTEFGSLATFAGLITAGIAVALQTVILSGVAYFFFIGRFGVRVGDRVTVSGITGDVVEIGLFRIYLMELTGPVSDLHSTGRMIVFSNAVLFQPSAFFKQLPGAEYAWHEVALTMSPETDHELAEKRLMGAVESVFEEYRESIDLQHAEANRLLHVPLESPRPQVRLRFVDAGLEMVIRYPVELQRASKIEDKLTRKLLEAIQQEPKLKLVSSGTPKIQSAA